jgi:LemA protein
MSQLKKSNIVLLSIIGVGIALLFTTVSIRNRLVEMDETTITAWAQVENQLQRRSDLIPNLVNSVKGYAKHESAVFDNIAKARAAMAGARTQAQKVAAAGQFESALSRLLVVVEQYPNLKSDRQFTQLMDELAGAENRISVERKKYNEHVEAFNITLRRFPSNIVASVFHFEKKERFKASEEAKETPKVQF